MVMRDTYRLENSVSNAVVAEQEAQKKAMRTAYSCHWPKDKQRYVVKDKHIDNGEYLTAAYYCLAPVGTKECAWIGSEYDTYARIQKVEEEKPSAK
jgi:hypothetical protein